MAHEVQCRLCKVRFDTEKEGFVLVGKKAYYHEHCYEEWMHGRNNVKTSGSEDFWYESVVDFLYRDVRMSINFSKLQKQWESFIKPEKQMTPKGIYFAIRYYYNVMHGNKEKALGGIGIVPSIYKESAQYWTDLEMKKTGTLESIIEQIKSRQNRDVQIITKKTSKKKDKSRFNLDDI